MGHATRCIPIINSLIEHGFLPIIASDGVALELLKKEFPELQSIELPSYNITYAKKANSFKLKLIKDSPHLLKTIKKEKKHIESIVECEAISGIISDNRFGVRHKQIPSVFITHQLRVLSGSTTWLSSKLHQKIISKFHECWVPDHIGTKNLSGNLGHIEGFPQDVKYLGPLTRFKKIDTKAKYDLLVLLSGPEPQRTFLEEKLLSDLEHYKGKILLIKGKIESNQQKEILGNITIYNFMTSTELEIAINESNLILSRSGYTTIMDLAKLEKKAFFIPTPGQFEQEYLAKKLNDESIVPYSTQNEFNIKMLSEVENYSGFESQEYVVNYNKLFSLF
ncbi:glycosyltransferase [Winogradskyella sp. PG-2]|uniref:glycosyltransferase n=1 Tax=Winogradskyella sp. PG-2 TaxID=754409 RepID=UPI0004587482|nr:glycosyltransferase [Winogradskyella sp. PG-2]BAO75913.1 UDP-N-acetylglucosamine--N-acetylmuramyl-(pentapeptide) pyrophosphoryl-undecaprenol N-acetylglucosamine transferase [Winogradskyella sp. PG-2]